MAKFHIRLKLQGLGFEVDGERQDIPAITAAVGKQFAGLLEPAAAVADGHLQLNDGGQLDVQEPAPAKRRVARRRNTNRGSSTGGDDPAIEFRHDSDKFGNPVQSWSVTEKCIWLLYVIENSTDKNEVSAGQLVSTFKEYFKPAGKLHPPHVTRELGKAKVSNPAPIGEEKGLWFLTNQGKEQAQRLIQGVLSTPTA
ncbi:MAG TPA: hypothetical protein VJW77_00415 [Terriglobia bacterium]|nr:hypothetical protein [Terriglobia bacterium]